MLVNSHLLDKDVLELCLIQLLEGFCNLSSVC